MKSTPHAKRASPKTGIIRQLAADDPRDLTHPCHREQWLELARAIGRLEAREEFKLLQGAKSNDETTKDRRTVRPLQFRHVKKALD
jgi:hypothetical protein